MDNKIKKAIALGFLVKGVVLVGAAVIKSRKEKQKLNIKFKNALEGDIYKEYLESKAHEINKIFSSVKELFESNTTLKDIPSKDVFKISKSNKVFVDLASSSFIEVDLEFDPLLKLEKKKGYYKIIARTSNNGITEFLLRLTADDWEGYMDISICDMEGYYFEGEMVFVVIKKGTTFTMAPELHSFIYYDFDNSVETDSLFRNVENSVKTDILFTNVENGAFRVLNRLEP